MKFPKIYYMNPYSKDGDFLGVGVGEFWNAKELNNECMKLNWNFQGVGGSHKKSILRGYR